MIDSGRISDPKHNAPIAPIAPGVTTFGTILSSNMEETYGSMRRIDCVNIPPQQSTYVPAESSKWKQRTDLP